jgi:hypothetical protein
LYLLFYLNIGNKKPKNKLFEMYITIIKNITCPEFITTRKTNEKRKENMI